MANLTVLEALRKTMEAIKIYVDDNIVIIEEDGLSSSAIINTEYQDLVTNDNTIIGAINEIYSLICSGGDGIGGSFIIEEDLDKILKDAYNIEEE